MGDAAAVALAAAISEGGAPALVALHLIDNVVGDEGAKALAMAISHSANKPALQQLSLIGNKLGPDGRRAIEKLSKKYKYRKTKIQVASARLIVKKSKFKNHKPPN